MYTYHLLLKGYELLWLITVATHVGGTQLDCSVHCSMADMACQLSIHLLQSISNVDHHWLVNI